VNAKNAQKVALNAKILISMAVYFALKVIMIPLITLTNHLNAEDVMIAVLAVLKTKMVYALLAEPASLTLHMIQIL